MRTESSVDFSPSVIGVLMSRPMIGLSRQMVFRKMAVTYRLLDILTRTRDSSRLLYVVADDLLFIVDSIKSRFF